MNKYIVIVVSLLTLSSGYLQAYELYKPPTAQGTVDTNKQPKQLSTENKFFYKPTPPSSEGNNREETPKIIFRGTTLEKTIQPAGKNQQNNEVHPKEIATEATKRNIQLQKEIEDNNKKIAKLKSFSVQIEQHKNAGSFHQQMYEPGKHEELKTRYTSRGFSARRVTVAWGDVPSGKSCITYQISQEPGNADSFVAMTKFYVALSGNGYTQDLTRSSQKSISEDVVTTTRYCK